MTGDSSRGTSSTIGVVCMMGRGTGTMGGDGRDGGIEDGGGWTGGDVSRVLTVVWRLSSAIMWRGGHVRERD